jgi:hypothetical protein
MAVEVAGCDAWLEALRVPRCLREDVLGSDRDLLRFDDTDDGYVSPDPVLT